MLAGDDGSELVQVAFEQFLELEHDARALQRRRGGPGRKGLVRGFNRRGDFGFSGKGDAACDFAQRRVVDIAKSITRAVDFLAVDEMADFAGQDGFFGCRFVHCFLLFKAMLILVMDVRAAF